jgi:hypothetical protein
MGVVMEDVGSKGWSKKRASKNKVEVLLTKLSIQSSQSGLCFQSHQTMFNIFYVYILLIKALNNATAYRRSTLKKNAANPDIVSRQRCTRRNCDLALTTTCYTY